MTIRFAIDQNDLTRVAGWAFDDSSEDIVAINALENGRILASSLAQLPRPDVGSAFSNIIWAKHSGFDFELPARATNSFIELHAVSNKGSTLLLNVQPPSVFTYESLSHPETTAYSPLPRGVMEIFKSLWPDRVGSFEGKQSYLSAKSIARFIDSTRLQYLKPLAAYFRFLNQIYTHCLYVERLFPKFNPTHASDGKDRNAQATALPEMMSIAHHLYVLSSYGVVGDFAEFGCFKGHSSAMLSYACHLLGIRMHVFDSFAGLPPSASTLYKAGDFKGSLEEVKRNIDAFGEMRAVSFHPGFFRESLPQIQIPNLVSLWMDVDLDSSARDLLTIADKVDARGAVFSHECQERHFQNGQIVCERSPDMVIPAIVDRFNQLGTPVTGRYVFGCTGTFWRVSTGIPVMPMEAVMVFAKAAAGLPF